MYYRTFTPQKITRVPDETKQICEGSMKIYFSENAVDDTMEDETGDIIFNAYTQNYFSNIKGNAFVPMSFKISKDAPKAKGFVKLFNKAEDESVKELGVTVDFINGAKRVEISEGVKGIGFAFSGCTALAEIHIPNSVISIDRGAFYRCPNVTIHAPAGSYAETYAKENNIPFVAV